MLVNCADMTWFQSLECWLLKLLPLTDDKVSPSSKSHTEAVVPRCCAPFLVLSACDYADGVKLGYWTKNEKPGLWRSRIVSKVEKSLMTNFERRLVLI